MKNKVPVQKGPIDASKPTSKMMTHDQKMKEKTAEMKETRSGQTLKEHMPRKGK